jgi:hypothetical protein
MLVIRCCEHCNSAGYIFYAVDYSNEGIVIRDLFCRCSAHSIPLNKMGSYVKAAYTNVTSEEYTVAEIMLS